MTWPKLPRQDLHRPPDLVGMVLIPRLPSSIRAELRRQMEQQVASADVKGFCVWHETACSAPAGGECGCPRVAITLVVENRAAHEPGRANGIGSAVRDRGEDLFPTKSRSASSSRPAQADPTAEVQAMGGKPIGEGTWALTYVATLLDEARRSGWRIRADRRQIHLRRARRDARSLPFELRFWISRVFRRQVRKILVDQHPTVAAGLWQTKASYNGRPAAAGAFIVGSVPIDAGGSVLAAEAGRNNVRA
jgi:hypothetical protein